MSMMNANAAATTAMTTNEPLDFVLPEMGDADFSSEELAEDTDGLTMSFPRIKIPAGGVLQFEIPNGDPQHPDYRPTLTGVILYNHASCAYWPEGDEYNDDVPPLCSSVDTVTQEIFKKTAESPETRLSDLYTDFFEDEDILRGIDSDIKAAALQSSFAMAGALLLGFVTGGLIEGVAECALWSLCDFGEAILTSEIDAALTLQLRYIYHVREPARMYDYYMDLF